MVEGSFLRTSKLQASAPSPLSLPLPFLPTPPSLSPNPLFLPLNPQSNPRPPRMQRPPRPEFKPQRGAEQERDEPEQHIDEIDPDGMLHSFEGGVVVGFARGDVDEEFAEDAEEGGPEDTMGQRKAIWVSGVVK